MKQQNKLKKTSDFQRIIKSKKRIFNDLFTFYYFYNQNFSRNINKEIIVQKEERDFKVGISVPKKKVKKANKRNKFKRQIKALVDYSEGKLGFTKKLKNCEIVIVMKENFAVSRVSFEKKKKIMNNIFLNLIKNFNVLKASK